jgi:hypothetical protein
MVCSLLLDFSDRFIRKPPNVPAKNAETGRIIANKGPSREYVASIESTPVVGVEVRNERVALFPAPSFRKCAATGITPQEHNGNGTPKIAPFITDIILLPERWLMS